LPGDQFGIPVHPIAVSAGISVFRFNGSGMCPYGGDDHLSHLLLVLSNQIVLSQITLHAILEQREDV
jgi:hypothetical protein